MQSIMHKFLLGFVNMEILTQPKLASSKITSKILHDTFSK